MKFEELDPKIQEWLRSELVTGIIVELNDHYDALGPEVRVIPLTIRALVTGAVKPDQFAETLKKGLFFLEDKAIADVATVIKERILRPIAPLLKSQYGFDIAKLVLEPKQVNVQPVARTMSIEGNFAPVKHPETQQAAEVSVGRASAAQQQEQLRARTMSVQGSISAAAAKERSQAEVAGNSAGINAAQRAPTARTMEIQGSFAPVNRDQKSETKRMIDIKKPEAAKEGSGGGANAQVTKFQGSFAPAPAQRAPSAPAVAPAAPPVRKPERDADILETSAPIGLSEIMPLPPTPAPAPVAPPVRPKPTFTEDPSSAKPEPRNTAKPIFVEDPTSARPTIGGKDLSKPKPQELTQYRDEHPAL